MKKQAKNSLRIIGGEWRSRKLGFPDNPLLRPTPDRVRETLFNWLQNDIHNAHCLDLFAGSGALGLEALSRGASECCFVETDNTTLQQLKENLALLKCDKGTLHNLDGLSYLGKITTPFDIVFLDPPFDHNLWLTSLDLLLSRQLLASNAKVYIESPSHNTNINLGNAWKILREKTAGDVRYQLITARASEQ